MGTLLMEFGAEGEEEGAYYRFGDRDNDSAVCWCNQFQVLGSLFDARILSFTMYVSAAGLAAGGVATRSRRQWT